MSIGCHKNKLKRTTRTAATQMEFPTLDDALFYPLRKICDFFFLRVVIIYKYSYRSTIVESFKVNS